VASTKAREKSAVIPIERIAASIYVIRKQKIMLDADLAILYGVETKVFNQAVRRNIERFPDDFMFQLTDEETQNLRSQIVTSSCGGRRYLPYQPVAELEKHRSLARAAQ
jgi:hypothetical protein